MKPAIAGHCAHRLYASAPASVAAGAFPRLVGAAARLAEEADPTPLQRDELHALAEVIEQRPLNVTLGPELGQELVDRLNRSVSNGRGTSETRVDATAIRDALEIDLGRWHGAAVNAEMLGGLDDEAVLARLTRRLPSEPLRLDAKRRLIAVRVSRSAFTEVRGDPEATIARVLALGRNPVDVPAASALHGTFAAPALRGALVRQDAATGRASVLAYSDDGGARSVFGVIDLAATLRVEVEGLSRPLSLCAPPDDLGPDPCLDPATLSVGGRLAELDARGRLRLSEHLPAVELLALASAPELALPLRLGQRDLVELRFPLRFEAPAPVIFAGASGERGPDLEVDVTPVGERASFSVTPSGGAAVIAILEREELARFQIVSRGGAGQAGASGVRGTDGTMGRAGTSAMCPSIPGGAGGPGGPGGRGGDGQPGGVGGAGGNKTQVLERAAKEGAIAFDTPGAELHHEGELCTFDVIIRKFGLTDPALLRMAKVINAADTDRLDKDPLAAGLEAIAVGYGLRFPNDPENLKRQFEVYDALYAWCRLDVLKSAG